MTMVLDAALAGLDEKISAVAARLGVLLEGAAPTPSLSDLAAPAPGVIQSLSNRDLGRYLDHTLLKPEATTADVEQLCREALEYGFAAVCLNPAHLATAVALLAGSPVAAATVVGFPLGATTPKIKAYESAEFAAAGAQELDMVMNVGALREGRHELVKEDIATVVRAAAGVPVKVILEAGLLSEEEKIAACLLARAAGVAFVKTSTGMVAGGATVEDVALMRRVVGPGVGVKAAGGVRDAATARAMLAAGASRIGTSSSIAIVSAP